MLFPPHFSHHFISSMVCFFFLWGDVLFWIFWLLSVWISMLFLVSFHVTMLVLIWLLKLSQVWVWRALSRDSRISFYNFFIYNLQSPFANSSESFYYLRSLGIAFSNEIIVMNHNLKVRYIKFFLVISHWCLLREQPKFKNHVERVWNTEQK